MRLNIYPEDLTGEVERVSKAGHVGVRIYLDGRPNEVKSALTFWFDNDEQMEALYQLFYDASSFVEGE